jgi:hypothetical protein
VIIWAVIAAIAAAAQTVIIAAAACYAYIQVREVRRARLLSILISLRQDIDSTEARQNRYKLFNELPDDLASSLTAEQDWVIDRVVVEYENIGSLVANGFIKFNLISSLYGSSTERSWKRAEPWVQKERIRRNSAPYATNFEKFAKKCIEYNAQKHQGGLQPFKRAVKLSRGKQLWPPHRLKP